MPRWLASRRITVATVIQNCLYTAQVLHFWIVLRIDASCRSWLFCGPFLLLRSLTPFTFFQLAMHLSSKMLSASQSAAFHFHPDRSKGSADYLSAIATSVCLSYSDQRSCSPSMTIPHPGPRCWQWMALSRRLSRLLIQGPFVLPWVPPFPDQASSNQDEFMSQVAKRLQLELDRLRESFPVVIHQPGYEESIDRRQAGRPDDELPSGRSTAGLSAKFYRLRDSTPRHHWLPILKIGGTSIHEVGAVGCAKCADRR